MSRTLRDVSHPLRQPYIDLLVSRVEVGDNLIKITGSKTSLARAAAGTAPHMGPMLNVIGAPDMTEMGTQNIGKSAWC